MWLNFRKKPKCSVIWKSLLLSSLIMKLKVWWFALFEDSFLWFKNAELLGTLYFISY